MMSSLNQRVYFNHLYLFSVRQQGNDNRFRSYEDCLAQCKVEDVEPEPSTTVATTAAAPEKKERNARCLLPKHYCKFRIMTPGWNYIMENNTCVFTYYSGCPDKVR